MERGECQARCLRPDALYRDAEFEMRNAGGRKAVKSISWLAIGDLTCTKSKEPTIAMISKHRKPTHPGEILFEEFLKPLGMSQVELAKKMNVPVQRVNTLINGKRDMTAETAILLSQALKTSSEFWMNLQVAYDLHEAREAMDAA